MTSRGIFVTYETIRQWGSVALIAKEASVGCE